jgi:outer membrane biosynthesis protein TonB
MKFPCRPLTLALLSSCTTHVETGQPQIVASKKAETRAEANDIEGLVRPKLSDFDACYKDEQQSNPKAFGKVLFEFTIAQDGRALDVRLLASTLKSASMEGCLLGKIEAWQFPPQKDGQLVKVRYPFSFQP